MKQEKNVRNYCFMRLICVITVLFLVMINSFEVINAVGVEKVVITDIKNWNHPVKEVIHKYGVVLKKVELLNNKTYPKFYLEESGEIISDFNFCKSVAEANGYWDFELIDDTGGNKQIVKVKADKSIRRIIKALCSINNENYEMSFIYKDRKDSLTSDELSINYQGVTINKQTDVKLMWKKIGYGTANEDNNNGYISTDANGHRRHSFGYPNLNSLFRVVVVNPDTNPKIERIILERLETKKRLRVGDSYSKLIKLYGIPNFEIRYSGSNLIKSINVYSKSDEQLIVTVDRADKVLSIVIEYIDIYKY